MNTLSRSLSRWLAGLLLVALVVSAAPAPAPAPGKVFLTVDEALALAFPKATVKRETVYLTEKQLELARELSSVAIKRAIVHPYVAKDTRGNVVGVAWFDTHVVRSKKETVMFVVEPARTLRRIEVLAFGEPQEYLPRSNWYAQFVGKSLGPELSLKRGIRAVTGATLTAEETTKAARRSLALHEVVYPKPAPKPPVPKPPVPTPAKSATK